MFLFSLVLGLPLPAPPTPPTATGLLDESRLGRTPQTDGRGRKRRHGGGDEDEASFFVFFFWEGQDVVCLKETSIVFFLLKTGWVVGTCLLSLRFVVCLSFGVRFFFLFSLVDLVPWLFCLI